MFSKYAYIANYKLTITPHKKRSEDDKTGYIWVLNTSVFLVADYKFKILE